MSNTEVDESLYSRQLYVYGHEAQKKLQNSTVLIVNQSSRSVGVAVEAAKNIILSGVHTVGYMDNSLVDIADLGSNFYCTEADVGVNTRGKASISKLSSLNPYVKVVLEEGTELTDMLLSRYSVLLLCGSTISEEIRINQLCRKTNTKFIAADTPGVFFRIFVDDGDEHIVSDADGQECQRGLIGDIDDAGVILTANLQRHGLSDGMYVNLSEMDGMEGIESAGPFKVRVINSHTFSIGDVSKYGKYVGTHGAFTQVKLPETHTFVPMEEALATPSIVSDLLGDGIYSHAFALALSKFAHKHNRMPAPTVASEATEVMTIMASELQAIDNGYTLSDDMYKRFWNLARVANISLSPVASVGGGIAGQEVIKAVSGKFTPIRQFMYWNDAQALPELDASSDLSSFESMGTRYDAYINALGADLVNKMRSQNLFLVGAGAIGCEMIKTWALMGVSTLNNGHITITDMDNIEKSNLNRQFLFRANDVGKLKSEAASNAARVMNPDLNITCHSLKVGSETESTYNEDFWKSIDGVYTALDNVDARLYLDGKCVEYKKCMVDSGTLGTAGNTQVIIPSLTESYGSTRDPPEQGIPICTLKNFPFKIEHTIQWARDVFEGDFRQHAEEVNNYLKKPNYIEELKSSPNTFMNTLEILHSCLVKDKPTSFADCIIWARKRFDEEFDHKIQQLLYNFPPDSLTAEGVPFWSGTKRQPTPIKFDPKDNLHMSFIIAAANLHAFNYNIFGTTNINDYVTVCENYKGTEFVPKTVKIAATEEEAKAMTETSTMSDDNIDAISDQLIKSLPTPHSLAGYELVPVEFEKDDDSNYHIAYITAASNLRARVYKIAEESAHMTKFIAGKIIPAIATTTALVTGFVCIEMFKILQNKPLEAYRNTFATLAINMINPVEPSPPVVTKTIDGSGKEWLFTMWDSVDIDLGKVPTLGEVVETIKTMFSGHVGVVTFGSSMLYMDFGMGLNETTKARLAQPITQVIETVAKTSVEGLRTLVLEVGVNYENEDGEDVDIDIPSVKVRLP